MRPSTGEKTDYRGWRYWVNVIPSADDRWTFLSTSSAVTTRRQACGDSPRPRLRGASDCCALSSTRSCSVEPKSKSTACCLDDGHRQARRW